MNSVVNPVLNRLPALEGDLVPSDSGPLTWSSDIRLCLTISELSRTLQELVRISPGLAALPIPLLQFRREIEPSLSTTAFSVSLLVQERRIVESLEVVQPTLLPGLVQPGDPTGPRPVDGAVRGQLGERHPAGCCCRAATPCL